MIGYPQVNPLEDQARQLLWQAQVPVTILPGDAMGVTVMSDFGERIHFPDISALQFFLAGFRLGERVALEPAPADPFAAVQPPEEDQGEGG